MKVGRLKIAEISDVHVGNPNTPTVDILNNLNQAFPNSPAFGEYDLFIIAGDFFDRLLNVPDPNVSAIKQWINRFLRLCVKYDVVVRVLEGTPSHDWKQPRLFTHVNEIAEIGADLLYTDTLSIEYNERFGINLLYIPDEWNPECDDTWIDVQKLLAERDLAQVDFTIMHGAFDYQLPSHVNVPTHNPDRYLGITKYLIFVGHIHLFSTYQRIVSAGSFDRLTHGEEGPKGHIEATVQRDGTYEIVHVENKGAKVYKTFTCTAMAIDEALAYLETEVEKLPQHSFVRVVASKADAILVSMDLLRKKFPTIRFSTKVDKDAEITTQALIDLRSSYQPVAITRENIKKLLLQRLQERGHPPELLARAEELLNGFVG